MIRALSYGAVVVVFLSSATALGQWNSDRAEMQERLEQFVRESEVAGKIDAGMKAKREELAKLRAEMEELELKQLDAELDTLIEAHPESSEQLKKLKKLAKQNVELRRELAEVQEEGKEILDTMSLGPDARQMLTRLLGPSSTGYYGRTQQYFVQKRELERVRERLARTQRDETRRIKRLETALGDSENLFGRIEKDNPEMFKLIERQKALLEEFADRQQELMGVFQDAMRSRRDQ